MPTHLSTPTITPAPTRRRTATQVTSLAAGNVPEPPTLTVIPHASQILTATPTGAAPSAFLSLDAPCDSDGGTEYGLLSAGGWEGIPPEAHPDLNLAVRGYEPVNAFRGLVDYDGEADRNAPQLWGLFADRRTPEIAHTYQVYDWDWSSNTRGDLIQDFPVTMVGLAVAEGETIFTPDFGLELGEGYVALVLYADTHRITLKYTGEDNVKDGYTLHLEGLCVFGTLLRLYNERHAAGRGMLPALRPGQPIGYAPGREIGVVIRDRGAFLDPRSRKDWWQGR